MFACVERSGTLETAKSRPTPSNIRAQNAVKPKKNRRFT